MKVPIIFSKGGCVLETKILETERTILRPLRASDAQEAFDNWATDSDVAKYTRWNVHLSVDETTAWLKDTEAKIFSDTDYDWGFVFKETGVLFGSGGLFYNEEHKTLELGYVLAKNFWGKGLATEVAQVMVDYAVIILDTKKIFASHQKGNDASGRVLEKLGFTYIGDGTGTSYDGKRFFETKEYISLW